MIDPFIYSVTQEGKLLWYQHVGGPNGTFVWNGAKEVGTGWNNFKKVFAGGGGVLYAINQNNELLWYRHVGQGDGSFNWQGPKIVGQGWDFQHVFATGDGIIYAIESYTIDITGRRLGGNLLWYRHIGYKDGSNEWSASKKVANRWRSIINVFSGGGGIIYTINESGDLIWNLHLGKENGNEQWEEPKKVGNGWNFDFVFSAGDGIIYAVEKIKVDIRTGQRTGGNLLWYNHLGYKTGTYQWQDPKKVGNSWKNLLAVITAGPGLSTIPIRTPGLIRNCGVQDITSGGIRPTTYGSPGGKWPRGNLTYNVSVAGTTINQTYVDQIMASAFGQWSAAAPYFSFRQVVGAADIKVQFGGQNVDERFGSAGGVLAVGFYPQDGRLIFDSSDNWSNPTALLAVALHEIGHVLGLSHSNSRSSLMYPFDLSFVTIDNETRNNIQNLYGWLPQVQLPDRGSSEGPSLANAGRSSLSISGLGELFMAWKGVEGDSKIYWSFYNGNNWSPQKRIEGIGSAHGPAITTGFTTNAADGTPVTGLFMAWDGIPGDSNIYFSQSNNLQSWSNQARVQGVGTSDRPALCMFNGRMRMAWTGISGDSNLYWSSYDGAGWSAQQLIRGRGSSDGPTMAVLGNRLYMFWKGIHGDSNVYYSWIDNQPAAIWQSQQVVSYTDSQTGGNLNLNIGTSKRLCAFTRGNAILLTWKGVTNDSNIYFSSFENNEFSGQVRIAGVGTSTGPGLAVLNNRVCLAWKGIQGNSNLYTSWLG